MAAGHLAISPGLVSSRPRQATPVEEPPLGDQQVQARLWQDPILAVRKQILSANTSREDQPAHTMENMGRQMESSRVNSACTRGLVRVLMVMLSGGPYAIDVETRLRSRYAILSALGAAGYSPKDAEHLGYFQVNWPKEKDLLNLNRTWRPLTESKSSGPQLLVPFEWFKPCPTRRTREFCQANSEVVVWWPGPF
jgi:hypothetical protein